MMDPMLLRAAERILAVAIAGVSIILGYRMFLNMPVRHEGKGKIQLPGGVSIYVSRIGPGGFFALFGACILAFSVYSSITYVREGASTSQARQQAREIGDEREFYSGISPAIHTDTVSRPAWSSLELRLDMEFLSKIPELLHSDLNEVEIRNIRARVERGKLILMHYAWEPHWGQFDDFRKWVKDGATDPIPSGLEAAAEYFRQRSK